MTGSLSVLRGFFKFCIICMPHIMEFKDGWLKRIWKTYPCSSEGLGSENSYFNLSFQFRFLLPQIHPKRSYRCFSRVQSFQKIEIWAGKRLIVSRKSQFLWGIEMNFQVLWWTSRIKLTNRTNICALWVIGRCWISKISKKLMPQCGIFNRQKTGCQRMLFLHHFYPIKF